MGISSHAFQGQSHQLAVALWFFPLESCLQSSSPPENEMGTEECILFFPISWSIEFELHCSESRWDFYRHWNLRENTWVCEWVSVFRFWAGLAEKTLGSAISAAWRFWLSEIFQTNYLFNNLHSCFKALNIPFWMLSSLFSIKLSLGQKNLPHIEEDKSSFLLTLVAKNTLSRHPHLWPKSRVEAWCESFIQVWEIN